ncbi:unnamed protein product [Ostreobium quekettii]|uniref:Uncharacterized protein n=1 Tax=Ostreobium quekettii TaxID=121088 RepID=A0A8S1IVG3_9CHLO|nr:unnamed protein product [Ostreobium quekettii]
MKAGPHMVACLLLHGNVHFEKWHLASLDDRCRAHRVNVGQETTFGEGNRAWTISMCLDRQNLTLTVWVEDGQDQLAQARTQTRSVQSGTNSGFRLGSALNGTAGGHGFCGSTGNHGNSMDGCHWSTWSKKAQNLDRLERTKGRLGVAFVDREIIDAFQMQPQR